MGSSGGKWRISILICMTTTNKYTILTTKIQCIYISSFLIFLQTFIHTSQDWLPKCVKLVTICYNLIEKKLDLYCFLYVRSSVVRFSFRLGFRVTVHITICLESVGRGKDLRDKNQERFVRYTNLKGVGQFHNSAQN